MANGRGVRPKVCKQCGVTAEAGALISFRALCEACAIANQTQFAREVHAKSGPAFDRWAERMREIVGAGD